MKMQSMAQFLIPGDIIIDNRRKYEVINVTTNGEDTTILFHPVKKQSLPAIKCVNKSEFFNVISAISLEILDKIISVEDAAEMWGLAPGYVKNLCAKNKVACKKIGKTWVVFKDQPNPKLSN